MFFQFFSWHICRIVVVEMMIYAGDVLYVIEHFGYIVTDDDDGAFLVNLLQHFVHLLLESAVDVGVGLIEDYHIGLGYDGACQEHSLQLSAAQGSDVAVFEFHQLHAFQGVEHLLMLCLAVFGKEALGLAEAGEHYFVYGDGELLVELIVLWEIAHRNLLYFLPVFIIPDVALRGLHQSQNEAHEGSLATTVGTDDTKIIVLIDGEIDVCLLYTSPSPRDED